MSEKPSEKSEMSEIAWAQEQLQERVAPAALSSHIGERIRAAARTLKWKPSRTKDIWYGDLRVSIKPRELRQLEEITGVRYGREELSEIDALIARADTLLASQGEDMGSPVLAALRALVGAVDRTGAGR
ncbi:MAG TPA: hypothetical protein VN155_16890 [Devosia sp.]|nr:hypothetical protein [Devosia sp.]